jgi:ankyrin repeat protein
MAVRSGKVKLLEKLWDWAKLLQLKPEELRKDLLSKDKSGQTACLMAVRSGNVKLLEKLWDWSKEGQIKPEELRNEVWLSKDNSGQTPWHKAAQRGKI